MWICIGKLKGIDTVIFYANTEDMIWHIGVVKKLEGRDDD
jgi:hypothetical protein